MYNRNIIDAHGVPLFCAMIPGVVVTMPAPPLVIDQPYSEEHGSLEDELITQASHAHALYKSDN